MDLYETHSDALKITRERLSKENSQSRADVKHNMKEKYSPLVLPALLMRGSVGDVTSFYSYVRDGSTRRASSF